MSGAHDTDRPPAPQAPARPSHAPSPSVQSFHARPAHPPGASPRERILARVRAGASRHEPVPHPGALVLPAAAEPPLALFARRLEGAGGEVVRLTSAYEARVWLAAWAAAFDSAATGARVPEALRPALRAAEPAHAALAVSVARGAGAETGTLVMDSREGRLLQLLAPVHLVWVAEGTVHATLEEAVRRVRDDRGAAIGLHSGPSKSADIGGVLVRGVHGPGRIVAAVVPDELLAGAWG